MTAAGPERGAGTRNHPHHRGQATRTASPGLTGAGSQPNGLARTWACEAGRRSGPAADSGEESSAGLSSATEPGDNPRCITRSMSAPAATIRAMTGDLERLPGPVSPAASVAGPALVAGELLHRVRAELPWSVSWGSGNSSLSQRG
jgi:hypothetical protein